MRLHAFILVALNFLYCKGHFAPDTLKSDLLSTPKGTTPGREPPPGGELERMSSGWAVPWPASGQETSTSPGAQPELTSPGRRYPEPYFKELPKFTYAESYRDHVYRELNKRVRETFLTITVRKYDLVSV